MLINIVFKGKKKNRNSKALVVDPRKLFLIASFTQISLFKQKRTILLFC